MPKELTHFKLNLKEKTIYKSLGIPDEEWQKFYDSQGRLKVPSLPEEIEMLAMMEGHGPALHHFFDKIVDPITPYEMFVAGFVLGSINSEIARNHEARMTLARKEF